MYSVPAEVRGSFQDTAPRKTAQNTVKHRDGGVGSVVANHRGGGKSSVVVTTLFINNRSQLRTLYVNFHHLLTRPEISCVQTFEQVTIMPSAKRRCKTASL